MNIQEYRPINIKEKPEIDNLQNCHKEITKVITKVKPKDHQCIAMDGYIIFQGNYHPDGIVSYKTPHKKLLDYEFDKFPEVYREEAQKLQIELSLNKKQIKELLKNVKALDNQCGNIGKKLELMIENAKCIKNNDAMKKEIIDFFRAYERFSENLTSSLASYDPETKNKIKNELNKLVHLVEEVIEKYLN